MKSENQLTEEDRELSKKFTTELNDLLTETFHCILNTEHAIIKDESNTDCSMREIHLLDIVSKSRKGKTISEIAKAFSITLASVTVMVNNLVAKGYLDKNKCDVDGRLIYVTLTKKGKELNKIHGKFHEQLVNDISQNFDETEKKLLFCCVERLNNFFQKS